MNIKKAHRKGFPRARPRFMTQGFKRQLLICDWGWWDDNASDVHKWLDANTEYGTKLGTDAEPGQMIKFKHEKELMWFLVKWN